MTADVLDRLAALIAQERETLLASWRQQVRELPSARDLDVPTLNDHVPGLLDEVAEALRSRTDETIAEVVKEGTPPVHGLQRLQEEFDIEEVVAEYNILRGCLHDLADANGLGLQGQPFHIINRVFDGAIGSALQTYATQRAREVQRRREEYLAFVAHDLRTPLNVISTACSVLELSLQERDAGAKAVPMLKALRRSVQQLEGLVAKVLEESAHLESEVGVKVVQRECDLWPLVEALIHDLHPVAGTSGTQLVNEIPEDLMIYADAGLLRRILQNLIANAIRYTPSGEVVIGARARAAEGDVECWVSDNGAGIPAELLENVFEKGASDPESTGGTGLGLAIVKTFAEAHGGQVSVETRPGGGSTFRFSLPTRATVRERAQD